MVNGAALINHLGPIYMTTPHSVSLKHAKNAGKKNNLRLYGGLKMLQYACKACGWRYDCRSLIHNKDSEAKEEVS